MKTIRLICLPIFFGVLLFSCQKSTQVYSEELFYNNASGLEFSPLLCPKVVPLCAGKNIQIGTVTVGTGIDGKIYITYTVTGAWRLQTLHLYAGPDSGIPVNNAGNPVPGQFPYKMDFYPPYLIQTYTFVLSNLPASFTVAAHAAVVRVGASGQVVQGETAWGDGCSGVRINPNSGGNWGTKFYYSQGNCNIEISSTNLCSQSLDYFFSSNPLNPWVDCNGVSWGDVTVGTFNYTEAEGRNIGNSGSGNSSSDSKKGFINVATLKLSWTNFSLESELLGAVVTVEGWLSTRGKLSPGNLPNGPQAVKDANNYISSWINNNICIR